MTVPDSKMRVVIVDDEPSVVRVERSLFEEDGRFEVVAEAGDGMSAVRLARTLKPNAVVLDVLMPKMDGWEALPLIRRVSPDTEVVVVSALGSESELNDKAVWLGAATYVPKTELITMPDLVAAACANGNSNGN